MNAFYWVALWDLLAGLMITAGVLIGKTMRL